MKTAISIPDSLFYAAEDAAQRLAISRSELYTKAVESFLTMQSDADVTRRLNEIYATESSALDPALYDASLRSIGAETW
jgi:hypothetical protein